jgi:two-component system, NtrC family, sensor histidine kinase GlrK
MSLAARIAVACLLLVALMAGLGAYQLTVLERLEAANEELGQIRYEATQLTLEIERRVEVLSEFTAKYFLLRDPAYEAELDRLRREVDEQLARLAALPLSPAEGREGATLGVRWGAYLHAVATREVEAAAADPAAGGEGGGGAALLSALGAVRDQLAVLLATSRRAATRQIDRGARKVEGAAWAAWGAAGLGIALALAATLLIVRSVAVPLARLADGTRRLAEGDLDHRVIATGSPELAALAGDFNAMAERLGELDRLKRDFVSHVSHDLKAPLASMEETLRLLLEGIPGRLSDEQERLLRLTLKSSRRLSTLIANLLDLARLDAGALAYHRVEEDLAELVRSAAQGVGPLLGEKGLRLALALPGGPLPVRCDGAALLRVVENLLANAVAFSPPGGTVEVTVREERGEGAPGGEEDAGGDSTPRAVVEVADAGPGVAEAEKERIFERFYQSRPGGPGTGLGLAIARAVAREHGGSVEVRDRPQGGSAFVLTLPRGGAAGAAAGGEDREAG